MKKGFINLNQIQIPFEEAIWRIDNMKSRRRDELLENTDYFKSRKKELEFLLKITYDITDKDFEYLCKFLLENDTLRNFKVTGGNKDGGQDLEGNDNIGLKYSVQCKQWADLRIDIKKIGEYFATTHHLRKKDPSLRCIFITTSYINENAKDFLRNYGIEYIDNTMLINECRKAGYLDSKNWGILIQKIQSERLKDLRQGINSSGFDILKKERLGELRHHLPKYMHPDNIIIASSQLRGDHPFFEHWS